MRSTFSGLNMAMLGLNASQKALDITGQNITNINTYGYTRQRLDQASISPSGAGHFNTRYGVKAGQGVIMTGISQIRDPFLDIQYRNQLSKVGTSDAKDVVLSGIGDIFDNVDVSTVQNALDEVVKQLQTLSTKVGQDGNDNLVRSSFEVLLSYVHQNATDLSKVRTELESKMDTAVVPDINQILNSIQELNKSIKSSQVLGEPGLELKDQRNSLIDELATYLPIEVVYGKEQMGPNFSVETMSIRLKDNIGTGGEAYLIAGDKCASFEYKESTDTTKSGLLLTSLDEKGQQNPELDVADKLSDGVLKGNMDMLNKEGMFGNPPSSEKGIGYYEKLFDSFVNTLATEMNKMNAYPNLGGGDLFVSSDGAGTGITAKNIKISDDWMSGKIKLVASEDADTPGSTANKNILKMVNLLSTDKIPFYAVDSKGNPLKDTAGDPILVFTGTMPSAYANVQAEQGIEKKSTAAILKNHMTVLSTAANARDSVMGVNLDEEVMSMMRYQQSYGAAARLMTTMDEALDKLINGMGVVGR